MRYSPTVGVPEPCEGVWMTSLQVFFSAIAAVVLFLISLQSFSHELQVAGGDTRKASLGRVTASCWKGFLAGAAATALVQSSSAMTALAVTLVDAGVISFKANLGILLGANTPQWPGWYRSNSGHRTLLHCRRCIGVVTAFPRQFLGRDSFILASSSSH